MPENKVLTFWNLFKEFGNVSMDASRLPLGLEPDDQVVGTVARLIPGKGIATLLEAVSLIAKIVPKLHLVVVGDGPERPRLEQYAQRLGLQGRALFLGWRDDVPSLMAGWDCYALPSLSEGFNVSVLEAMASRLPVVASDLPALRGRWCLVVAASWCCQKRPGIGRGIAPCTQRTRKGQGYGQIQPGARQRAFWRDRMVRCTRSSL